METESNGANFPRFRAKAAANNTSARRFRAEALAGLIIEKHEKYVREELQGDFKPWDYKSPLSGDYDSCKKGCIDEGGSDSQCSRSCEGY